MYKTNKKIYIYIFLFLITYFVSHPAFAEEPVQFPEDVVESKVKPSLKEKKAREGYIVNLKDLIKKSKKKLEKVDGKLQDQAKMRRNQQREQKAREYYEKALRLYDEGKYDKAQELWNKAIKITEHAEMQGYIRENARKTKRREKALLKQEERRLKRLEVERGYTVKEVEKAYSTGVRLYKKRNFIAAREEFEQVENMFPDHKATRSYLKLIEQEIQNEQDAIIEAKVKEANEIDAKDKKAWKGALAMREKERKSKLEDQADLLYQEALRLYKARQFTEAKQKFKEVEWILPDYKNTIKYLSRIDKDIRKNAQEVSTQKKLFAKDYEAKEAMLAEEEKKMRTEQDKLDAKERARKIKEEADFMYKAGITHFDLGEYAKAQMKFEEVADLLPDYKNTADYLKRVNYIQQGQVLVFESELKGTPVAGKNLDKWRNSDGEFTEKEYTAMVNAHADIEYDKAVKLYKDKNYEAARDQFKVVGQLAHDYKSTNKYLKKIDDQIGTPQTTQLAQVPQASSQQQTQYGSSSVKQILSAEDMEVQKAIDARQSQFANQAELKYSQAMDFYNRGNFTEAKMKFIQVEAVYPNYKQTREYLAKLDDNMNNQWQTQAMSSPNRTQTVRVGSTSSPASQQNRSSNRSTKDLVQKSQELQQKSQQLQSKAKRFEDPNRPSSVKRVGSSMPEPKKVDVQMADAEQEIQEPTYEDTVRSVIKEKPKKEKRSFFKKKKTQYSQEVEDKAERFFHRGLWHYKAKEYHEARDQFVEANALIPGYRKSDKYIKKIDKKVGVYEYRKSRREKKVAKSDKKFHKKKDKEWKKIKKERLATIEEQNKEIEHLKKERYKEHLDIIKEQEKVTEQARKERSKLEKERRKLLEKQIEDDEYAMKIADLDDQIYNQEYNERYEDEKYLKKRQIKKSVGLKEKKRALKREQMIKDKRAERESLLELEKEVMDMEEEELMRLKRKELEARKEALAYSQEIERKTEDFVDRRESYLKRRSGKGVDKKLESYWGKEFDKNKDPEMEAKKQQLMRIEGEIEKEERILSQYEYDDIKNKRAREKAIKDLNLRKKDRKAAAREREKEFARQNKDIHQKIKQKEKEELKRKHVTIKALYAEAVKLYKEERYTAAREKFRIIDGMKPGYRSTRSYLKKIEKNVIFRNKKYGFDENDKYSAADYEKSSPRDRKSSLKDVVRGESDQTYDRLKETEYLKAKSDKKLEKYRRKTELKKLKEKQKQELAHIKHQKKLEKIQLKKEKAEQRRKDIEVKKAQKRVERAYDEAFGLYTMNRVKESQAKFQEFERLLASGGFDSDYVMKMRKRVVSDRQKMERQLAQERHNQEDILSLTPNKYDNRTEKKMAMRRQKELDKLEQRIKKEEEKLDRERRIQESQSLDIQRRKDELSSQSSIDQRYLFSNQKRKADVTKNQIGKYHVDTPTQKKERELKRLVKQRQKNINKEREKIRREFAKNLNQLYSKAVHLHKAGNYDQAHRIFIEIDSMQPNYKKTSSYLARLERGDFRQTSSIEPVASTYQKKKRKNVIQRALDAIEHELW